MTTIKDKISKQLKFRPSVNILRDNSSQLNYIPTPNAVSVYNQLINNYQIGTRSFSIVGAYGTGKSAFLLAFKDALTNVQNNFSTSKAKLNVKDYDFLSLVGEYSSLIEIFADKFGLANRKSYRVSEIINKINDYHGKLAKNNKGLVILIDEFGKFLEFAAKNNPEKELYFIQQLAEFCSDTQKNIFFVTTLHQDFNGYGRDLSKMQQNEWDKVRGRLKEITFNEPVEQLLFLASERLKQESDKSKSDNFQALFEIIEKSKAFPLKDYFNQNVAKNILPFDILSAAVLTLSLQKYGQNERSLFSFIESNDPLGLNDVDKQVNPYYNISNVYDYLIHNYYSFLNTKYNPHYTQWSAIRTAIERTEGLLNSNIVSAIKIVKTIGLLNIFAPASIKLNEDFLVKYALYSLGIKHADKILKTLEGLKIIRFVKHTSKYVLFEGTDIDIELAIDSSGNLVERVTDVVHYLNSYFDFPYISAKASFYDTGTPRIFSFSLTDIPLTKEPKGEIDGYINLIFSDKITRQEVIEASHNSQEAILYGFFTNTTEIKNLLFEIKKIEKTKETYIDDKVVVRELNSILQHQIKLLNHFVLGSLYNSSIVEWYCQGEEIELTSQREFNRCLSDICDRVYHNTPIYRNELVNKTKLSGPVVVARKNLLAALTSSWHLKDFGFETSKFPPEKTIYLSLLRETGIHAEIRGVYSLQEPTNNDLSFTQLWHYCMEFLRSTRSGKRNLQELVDGLLSKPFKLKQGFIDFWLPIFLFTNRDDFALFHDDIYIPYLSQENLELLGKNPKEYEVKAFNIAGVKLDLFNSYRRLLNLSQKTTPKGPNFIETIRPFLTFYKQLPNYSKNTSHLDTKTLALKNAISLAKDPEETFFEHFPKALGYTITELQKDQKKLTQFVDTLQNSIKEIRTSFDRLIERLEIFISNEIEGDKMSYPAYKSALQMRYKSLKKHLLLPHQKPFVQRVFSETADNKAWLSSICHACIGKSLEELSDSDEEVLYDKLKDVIHELDNLCELSASDFDENNEIVFKLEVTSFVEGLKRNLVRLPKSKNTELLQLQSVVKAKLGKDKQLNIATLAKILEELLQK